MDATFTEQSASETRTAKFLDRAIPLRSASHLNVISYSVDIPMRYAECFATLADGRKVRLRDSRQFIGWSGWVGKRSFLFRSGRRRIEIQTNSRHPGGSGQPRDACEVITWPGLRIGSIDLSFSEHVNSNKKHVTCTRKFIARDGSQLVIRRVFRTLARHIGHRRLNSSAQVRGSDELTGGAPV